MDINLGEVALVRTDDAGNLIFNMPSRTEDGDTKVVAVIYNKEDTWK